MMHLYDMMLTIQQSRLSIPKGDSMEIHHVT
jgi:hypothetical protein